MFFLEIALYFWGEVIVPVFCPDRAAKVQGNLVFFANNVQPSFAFTIWSSILTNPLADDF